MSLDVKHSFHDVSMRLLQGLSVVNFFEERKQPLRNGLFNNIFVGSQSGEGHDILDMGIISVFLSCSDFLLLSPVFKQARGHYELDSIPSPNPFCFFYIELHEAFKPINTCPQNNVDLGGLLSFPEVYIPIQYDFSPLPEIIPSSQIFLSFIYSFNHLPLLFIFHMFDCKLFSFNIQ
jgi:hypothetical protein